MLTLRGMNVLSWWRKEDILITRIFPLLVCRSLTEDDLEHISRLPSQVISNYVDEAGCIGASKD